MAARLSDRIGRKPILVPGGSSRCRCPAWWWIDLANVLLGANQALVKLLDEGENLLLKVGRSSSCACGTAQPRGEARRRPRAGKRR